MKIIRISLFFLVFLSIILPTQAHDQSYYRLSEFKSPTQEASRSIGSYAKGCLRGGKKLPIIGEGFQLMRLSRERYYVHSNLYDFIHDFAKNIKLNHPFGGIVIGDTGQALGGPMQSGHKSHQNGLDVDIWLRPAFDTILTPQQREEISAITHVTKSQTIRDSWSQDYTDFILKAAAYNDVARIFVNPAIKRTICAQTDWDKNLALLAKIRPWYGHDAHIHVRLKCPKESKDCINQYPPKNHHGCTGNDIDWWFTDEALYPKPSKEPKIVKNFSHLHPKCQALYQDLVKH